MHHRHVQSMKTHEYNRNGYFYFWYYFTISP